MSSILDRVNKLLAMTASSHEEEARTAALMTCKLIVKHKLVISERQSKPTWQDPTWQRQPTWVEKRWPGNANFDAIWQEVLRRQAESKTPKAPADKWLSVRAHKLDTCGGCEGQIHPGDYMWIREGRRPQHFECFDPKWEVAE